jgi:16S rRNA pseudouridine516 synthase
MPSVQGCARRRDLRGLQQVLLVACAQAPEPVAAAGAEICGDHTLRLTVSEGKYHQVKRMVAAAGNRVEALHRESVGGLVLPADLRPGEWRWLDAVDLEKLRNLP